MTLGDNIYVELPQVYCLELSWTLTSQGCSHWAGIGPWYPIVFFAPHTFIQSPSSSGGVQPSG